MDPYTIEQLRLLRLQQSIHVACVALWVYEYLCTFGLEVLFIWGTRWSLPKTLYLVTRYLQFVISAGLVYQIAVIGHASGRNCARTEKFTLMLMQTCIVLEEGVFTVRTWTVLGRTRRSGVALAVFFLGIWIPCFLISSSWFSTITPSASAPGQTVSGECFKILKSSLGYVSVILVIIFYVVNLSLMSFHAYPFLTGRYPSLYAGFVRLVYVDGISYYVYLLSLAITNLVIILTLPLEYSDMLITIQQFLASILACRMMLNLRAYAQPADGVISSDLSMGRIAAYGCIQEDAAVIGG